MLDLNALSLPELFDALVRSGDEIGPLIRLAREEDCRPPGDVTTASLIDSGGDAEADLVACEEGVVAGLALAPVLLGGGGEALGDGSFEARVSDGDPCRPGQRLGRIRSDVGGLLRVERPFLNFVSRLCGIATLTRRYMEAVAGTGVHICDTRKTTPGWRSLEKYAVRCGGGTLHRLGLHDAALYKDNHLARLPAGELASALGRAVSAARSKHDLRFVEVEVDTLDQLREVMSMEEGLIDIVLLDNMSPSRLREAVARRKAERPHLLLEASGGVTLQTVRAIAETGIDRISVGALTHSAAALDLSLELRP